MKIIDLRSDTVTRPSPDMRQAIAAAEVGDDVFEDDPTVKKLEEKTAEILGHEAALYVPSGTMANQTALRILSQPGDEILCESFSHIFNNEVAGAAAISGIQLHPLLAQNGILTPEILEPQIRSANIHTPVTRAIALENTHNRASGTVYPMELLGKIKALAGKYGLFLFLDGARIWNAAAFHKVKPSAIASQFDCVTVCFSKGLGAPVGSAVVSTKERIARARRVRKMLGGGMRQVGIIAAGALYALEHNLDRISEDHVRAKQLARNLASCELFGINLETVQTNILVITLKPPLEVSRFCAKLAEKGVLAVPFGAGKIRVVAHLDINDEDIERASKIMLETAGAQ
ncbi:MAG TPA: low specificity L-threonine aldolase [candidate division Zixibacteria bacterium]|jgi:threonine aldolase|nr:low specificity L-threonine aldolase [candidate division Zixibacteria bacterium]